MKLLTLNTHSLQEENYNEKFDQFIKVILKEKPDVIALQEVNQTITSKVVNSSDLFGYYPCPNETIPIREDNHALRISAELSKSGVPCSWTWVSSKVGYDKYDEGLSLIVLNSKKITQVDSFYISQVQDYHNWKTRKVLGVRISDCNNWFFTVHMGWWNDKEEPFSEQWKRFNSILQNKLSEVSNVWIMGDFNSPAELRNQGYDLIKSCGWIDSYLVANDKDGGITVEGVIDGWKGDDEKEKINGMRIDHIWCRYSVNVKSSKVIFNGVNEPVVSDHFGVLVVI